MKEVATVLYGSDNYGLNGPNSDKDYKVLLCPSFDEMYCSHKVDAGDLPKYYDKEHYSPMDCRKFDSLVHNCNPNVLEMVFSTNWDAYENVLQYVNYAKDLLNSHYLALRWNDFYSAVHGIVMNTFKRYGFNNKAVSRGYYLFLLVEYVVNNNFQMTDNTWRNNEHSVKAREVRFGSSTTEELKRLGESVQNLFEDSKQYFSFSASQWCKNHPNEVVKAKEKAEILTNYMKFNIVLPLARHDF